MSLLNNVGKISFDIGNKLGNISSKLDGITGIAKGILCLPTLVSGLITSIPSLINGISAGVANLVNGAVDGFVGAIDSLVNQKIQKTVNKINGAATEALGVLALVAGTVGDVFAFARDTESKVLDVLNFTASKDNCSYAIAELDKCATKQVESTFSPRVLKNIASNELRSAGSRGQVKLLPDGTIDTRASKNITVASASEFIAKDVSAPGGLVDRLAQKHINCSKRAESIATKANSII